MSEMSDLLGQYWKQDQRDQTETVDAEFRPEWGGVGQGYGRGGGLTWKQDRVDPNYILEDAGRSLCQPMGQHNLKNYY